MKNLPTFEQFVNEALKVKESKESISVMHEGIKGHILDVIDELNKLNFTGTAYREKHQIVYVLDDKNPDKEARAVKKLAKQLGWEVKDDQEDRIFFELN